MNARDVGAREPDRASDARLLQEIQSGEELAAEELFRRYAPRLGAFARKRWPAVLASRLDPEDVIQSVFRSFFRHARQGMYELSQEDELWNLLMVICINKLRVQYVRHCAAKRDARRTQSANAEWLTALWTDPDATLDLIVRDQIERLPSDHRRVAELRLQGHEVASIAELIGRSRRSVERLLQECRQRLLQSMREAEEKANENPEDAGNR
ncbi:MAG TPA: sigma-70 family RNA polymerase sigma factor [Gemmataceae bacterium]|nr:sigma-70 family RNA polymerase sigma factor [Gemmataceae bacterium]